MDLRHEWGGAEDIAAHLMSIEHEQRDGPDVEVRMHRDHRHFSEVAIMRGYRAARVVVASFPAQSAVILDELCEVPGVVVSIPIGTQDAETAGSFAEKFERIVRSYETAGNWQRDEVA
jgi:hypothetical protein